LAAELKMLTTVRLLNTETCLQYKNTHQKAGHNIGQHTVKNGLLKTQTKMH